MYSSSSARVIAWVPIVATFDESPAFDVSAAFAASPAFGLFAFSAAADGLGTPSAAARSAIARTKTARMRKPPRKAPKLRGTPGDVKRRRAPFGFAFRGIACYPPAAAMRLPVLLLVSALVVALAACGTSISGINARPDKYYQHKVKFTGRVGRIQFLPHETLLEVADPHGGRIIVRGA